MDGLQAVLPSLTLETALLAAAIMAVGATLQAAIGMGLALFVVPLLLLLDVRFVPGPLQLAAIVLACGMALRERSSIEWRGLGVALGGLVCGTALGAAALSALDPAGLPRLFGGLILLAVLLSLAGLVVRPTGPALLTGGAIAGIMGTMVGIHGPPIALVLQHAEPSRLRAMLAAFFVIGYVAAVAALVTAGLFGREQLVMGLVLAPGAALGLVLGPLVVGWLDRRLLRAAVLAISGLSALGLLLR